MMGKAFRLLLLLPAACWLYEIFSGQYGADPAKHYNHETGELALYYLLLNLGIGAAIAFGYRFPALLRFLLTSRRFLGVTAFVFLVAHAFLYLAMEGFEAQAFTQLATKTYLILGASAWLILLLLALTSNDLSVRKLGAKRWKVLHRFNHLATALVTVHVLLIEKSDRVKFGLFFILLWSLQGARFVYRKTQMKKGAA
jgi:methionine sulfoxide reductase heme-binding subunit